MDSGWAFTEPLKRAFAHLVLLKVVYQLLWQLACLSQFLTKDEVNRESFGVLEPDPESTPGGVRQFLDFSCPWEFSSPTRWTC